MLPSEARVQHICINQKIQQTAKSIQMIHKQTLKVIQ